MLMIAINIASHLTFQHEMTNPEVPNRLVDYGRSFAVGTAMAADIAVNYAPWIAAKRIGAGLPPFPPLWRDVYKGAGSLWLSLGPTTMLEDAVKKFLDRTPSLNIQHELFSSLVAGALAGGTFCAQVEHIITAAHAQGTSMGVSVVNIFQTRGGLRGLLLPPGMIAMVGREMPFVAALFYVRPFVDSAIYGSSTVSERRFTHEILAGFTTSALTCPFSHVPSVIAAYQQGHGVSLSCACKHLYKEGGMQSFWRGFLTRTASIGGTMVIAPSVLRILGHG